MGRSAHVITMWSSRREVHLMVHGAADPDLVARLDTELQDVLSAGATHVVVDLHRLAGNDTAILELLAATCHQLWRIQGVMEVAGVRDRLATSPEVGSFPEVFGDVTTPGTRPSVLR